jgi:hypothetical protein
MDEMEVEDVSISRDELVMNAGKPPVVTTLCVL